MINYFYDIDTLSIIIVMGSIILGIILIILGGVCVNHFADPLNTRYTSLIAITVFVMIIQLGSIFAYFLKQSVKNFSDEGKPIKIYSLFENQASDKIMYYNDDGVVDEISATEVIVKHTDGLSRLELHKFTDPNSNRYAYRYVYYISK